MVVSSINLHVLMHINCINYNIYFYWWYNKNCISFRLLSLRQVLLHPVPSLALNFSDTTTSCFLNVTELRLFELASLTFLLILSKLCPNEPFLKNHTFTSPKWESGDKNMFLWQVLNKEILEKPKDKDNAFSMLKRWCFDHWLHCLSI